MNINIVQYRACIGSFDFRQRKIMKPTKKNKCQKYPTNYSTKGPSFLLQIFYVYLYILTLTSVMYSNMCVNFKYQYKNTIQTSPNGFSTGTSYSHIYQRDESYIQPDYHCYQLTNFEMKYVNGNRTRNGIKIGHYNEGHSMM